MPITASAGISRQDKTRDNFVVNAGYFYSVNPLDLIHDLNYFSTDDATGIRQFIWLEYGQLAEPKSILHQTLYL